MSTLNRYLSNSSSRGITPQQSYDNLVSEFRKGNVSYPRTDGKNHAPLRVIKDDVNRYVKQNIENSPNFEVIDLGREILVKGDPFILNEFLKLSTPATIVSDYQKCRRIDYKNREVDIYVGLKHEQYEKSLQDNFMELNSFDFNELILDTVSNELSLDREELEINFHDINF